MSDPGAQTMVLSHKIRPILAGQPPEVQGAVLGELMSMWIAGFNPELREEVLAQWLGLVKALVPVSEKEMFGGTGFPQELQ